MNTARKLVVATSVVVLAVLLVSLVRMAQPKQLDEPLSSAHLRKLASRLQPSMSRKEFAQLYKEVFPSHNLTDMTALVQEATGACKGFLESDDQEGLRLITLWDPDTRLIDHSLLAKGEESPLKKIDEYFRVVRKSPFSGRITDIKDAAGYARPFHALVAESKKVIEVEVTRDYLGEMGAQTAFGLNALEDLLKEPEDRKKDVLHFIFYEYEDLRAGSTRKRLVVQDFPFIEHANNSTEDPRSTYKPGRAFTREDLEKVMDQMKVGMSRQQVEALVTELGAGFAGYEPRLLTDGTEEYGLYCGDDSGAFLRVIQKDGGAVSWRVEDDGGAAKLARKLFNKGRGATQADFRAACKVLSKGMFREEAQEAVSKAMPKDVSIVIITTYQCEGGGALSSVPGDKEDGHRLRMVFAPNGGLYEWKVFPADEEDKLPSLDDLFEIIALYDFIGTVTAIDEAKGFDGPFLAVDENPTSVVTVEVNVDLDFTLRGKKKLSLGFADPAKAFEAPMEKLPRRRCRIFLHLYRKRVENRLVSCFQTEFPAPVMPGIEGMEFTAEEFHALVAKLHPGLTRAEFRSMKQEFGKYMSEWIKGGAKMVLGEEGVKTTDGSGLNLSTYWKDGLLVKWEVTEEKRPNP